MADVVSIDQLRALIRAECREAVSEVLHETLIRALSPPAPSEPEPATWSMAVPDVVAMVGESTDSDFVRQVLAYERQCPDGSRPGVIAACEVRLVELGG